MLSFLILCRKKITDEIFLIMVVVCISCLRFSDMLVPMNLNKSTSLTAWVLISRGRWRGRFLSLTISKVSCVMSSRLLSIHPDARQASSLLYAGLSLSLMGPIRVVTSANFISTMEWLLDMHSNRWEVRVHGHEC